LDIYYYTNIKFFCLKIKNKHGWPRYSSISITRWKLLFFLSHFWSRLPTVEVLVGLGDFLPRLPTVNVLVFHGHFWPRLLLLAILAMNTNDESYVYDLRFWATFGIPLCQTRVRIRCRQSLAPHCATKSSSSGRQLLAWDCKYEYACALVGKRWQENTSILYPRMERVKWLWWFLMPTLLDE